MAAIPFDPGQLRLRRMHGVLRTRGLVLQAIRSFFSARDFLEVDTPVRIAAPAPELHIDAEPAGDAWLRTSPELHMKRLLASGLERLFQIGPCFRRGERGRLHHPEYTMLEWYRAGADYLDVLADTKSLLLHVAGQVLGRTLLSYRGQSIDLVPWECRSVRDAFLLHAGWDPVLAYDADRFDLDLVDRVGPSLPVDVPVLLMDYPREAAALARLKPSNPALAERWELYVGGIELANAYSELTDADEQQRRFEQCAEQRKRLGRDTYPPDTLFLESLRRGMPPAGGVALGVDRLVMLLSDAAGLDEVIPFLV
jgi:lysyl-tRNA synthetase class 2